MTKIYRPRYAYVCLSTSILSDSNNSDRPSIGSCQIRTKSSEYPTDNCLTLNCNVFLSGLIRLLRLHVNVYDNDR